MTFVDLFTAGAILCLAVGCANLRPTLDTDKIKRDLIGHTMGGREKSWQFQSPEQIRDLKILSKAENTVTVSLLLHDSRTSKYFHANALLTYRGKKLISVGELFIRQING
jgi:hypothetical protein